MASRPPTLPGRKPAPATSAPAPVSAASTLNPPLPVRPPGGATVSAHDPLYPPQLPANGIANDEDAPPPSYEDAIADEIAPVDGYRGEFSGVTNENAPSEVDEKGRGGGGVRKGDGPAGAGAGAGSGGGGRGGGSGGHAVV